MITIESVIGQKNQHATVVLQGARVNHNEFKKRIDSLAGLMEMWADWQRGYSGIQGYGGHSPGLQSGYASSTFDDLCEQVDNEVCRLIDAAVDDLPAGQHAAINKRYEIAAVFRFPRGNYEDLLAEAHETLMRTLPRKGVVV